LETEVNYKNATDEQAAEITNNLKDLKVHNLEGVYVSSGRNESDESVVVISPMMGSHLILTYPFAGKNISL
jgi:uncharacterized protein YciI